MNNQNLRPCEHKFTQEEAKKGGKAEIEYFPDKKKEIDK